MTSSAEQIASNFNFSSFRTATDLKKRLLFTLGVLIVYRLGAYLPVPGIDPQQLASFFQQNQGGIVGMFDMFAGGAVQRMAIFTLSVMPYISASIIMQLFTVAVPSLAQLKKEGEQGQRKINQYARYGTVLLAFVQSYGVAIGIQGLALNPGPGFITSTVIALTGGSIFLMWLGEQITARGIGNGISLIIFSGIVAELPSAIVGTLELGRQGAFSSFAILAMLILVLLVMGFVVFMELSQRRLTVQYPKRQVGGKLYGGSSSHLPLKVNTAGVIPPIFASALLLFPITLASFTGDQGPQWLTTMTAYLGHGQPAYMLLYATGIIFFSFFYTSIIFNPEDVADNLKKQGGFIPGIRPGERTAQYIDYVLTRLTVVGAAYLTVICLLPEFLIAQYRFPFYFGGTSVLIAVSVTMDTVTRVQSYLFAHQYEGLIKKSRLAGRRR